MRKISLLMVACSLLSLAAVPAMADITDYLGQDGKPLRCPQTLVVRPDLNQQNIFYPIDGSSLETASNMIGSTVANGYREATVIRAKDLDQYRPCNVPVVLVKVKSYTTESALFGQHIGKITVSILRFMSPNAKDPEKETEFFATGERHWGDDVPFMNAVTAVCEKIRKTTM